MRGRARERAGPPSLGEEAGTAAAAGQPPPAAPPAGLRPPRTAAGSGSGSLWEDLRDAFPLGQVSLKLALKAASLVASIIVFVALPALRVENGSVDHCDPIRTYGEITEQGMQALVDAAGGGAGGTFLDVGSGFGAFALFACGRGGFARCLGVEVQKARHEAAAKALAAAGTPTGVTFVQGDIRNHPQVFDGLRLAYWNNLCFPADVAKAVAEDFAARAPAGAEIWALAPLPRMRGVAKVETEISLRMSWREEAYQPYRYKRDGPAETSERAMSGMSD